MNKLNYPTKAYLEISPVCNFKCSFCFTDYKNTKFMNFKEIKIISSKLKDLHFNEIILFGGEPTINPEIEKIIKTLHKNKFKLKMVTNGFELDKIKKSIKYLEAVSISIHGLGKTHDKIVGVKGAFEKVSKNINFIYKDCLSLGVLFSPTPENKNEIYKTAQFFSDKISYFGVNRLIRIDSKVSLNFNEVHNLIKEVKKINKNLKIYSTIAHSVPYCLLQNEGDMKFISNCKAGIDTISIDNVGNIKICSASQLNIGNIFNKKEKIYSDEFKRYRSLKWLPNKCKKCKYLGLCFAGCKFSKDSKSYAGDVLIE